MISSFPNTLRRWYSTVRGLMKSWAPIFGFVCPSRASWAIRASWAVSLPPVSTVRLRAVSPVARSSRRARSANASRPISVNSSVATKPFAIDEVGAGEFAADAGAAESPNRFAVEALRGLAVAQQRARAGLDPQPPVAAAGAS